MGQRLTGMTSRQDRFPVAASRFRFARHGQSGATLSNLLPFTAKVADELCFIKTMHTEAINHDPAVTFFQTGAQLAGRPSIGAWVSYGLGSENQDLPAFVVMISRGSGNPNDQPLYDRLWGSGFLPTTYQGIKFRSVGDPVLYLNNPAGLSAAARRRTLDDLSRLDALNHREFGDPEILTRIAQYEMAFRMQTSVPELIDLSGEPDRVFDMYGPDSRTPGTFAANCLLARRLAERGVRFIQLFHRGWDQHTHLPTQIAGQCRDTDQASAALVTDLKAARPARRHAGHLGRRIRPDRLLPGHTDRSRLRARPPSTLLHDLAVRRRHQARHHSRRDRRFRLQHRSRPRPRP